jgi:hypothetical protein
MHSLTSCPFTRAENWFLSLHTHAHAHAHAFALSLSHSLSLTLTLSFSLSFSLSLHGLSPRANYTDRATAACRRSDCQLLWIEGATWSA